MAKSKPTHVVTHPSLYLRVEGKMQGVAEGTQLTLTDKVAAGMVKRGFVKSLKDAKVVDVGEVADKE